MCLSLETLISSIRIWLTYSGRTNRPVELCYIFFFIPVDLTRIVNFPTWTPGYDSHNPALLDLFISSDTSIVLQWLSLREWCGEGVTKLVIFCGHREHHECMTPFGELQIVFSTKVSLLYLLYSTAQRCCLLHLIKQDCLIKTFLRHLILKTWVSLLLLSLLELI